MTKLRLLSPEETDDFMNGLWVEQSAPPKQAPLRFRIMLFLGVCAVIGTVANFVVLPNASPHFRCLRSLTIPSCYTEGVRCVVPVNVCGGGK